jgi:hypothetical protein
MKLKHKKTGKVYKIKKVKPTYKKKYIAMK